VALRREEHGKTGVRVATIATMTVRVKQMKVRNSLEKQVENKAHLVGYVAKKIVKKKPGKTGIAAKGGPGRKPRGRVGKRGGGPRNKRKIQITGLDLLHTQTLLSTTSPQGQKLPPAPGCIDQQLPWNILPGAIPVHEEIPPNQPIVANDATNVPRALQVLFFNFVFYDNSIEFSFSYNKGLFGHCS
jgi:hypothetical protein